MDISAPNNSSLSLESFENFIQRNPNAKSIVVSQGHIVARDPVEDQDQVTTKEAFKVALKAKYPDQENLVDEAWDGLQSSGQSWSAYTIRQVIERATENADGAVWRDVDDVREENKNISEEEIAQLSQALDDYAERIEGELSPQERTALQEQLVASSIAVGGVGLVGLAAHVNSSATNAALANLLSTISSSLPHAAALPMMSSVNPAAAAVALPTTHLAVATAMMGASTISASTASVEATIASAAPAIASFIVAGAIAHRLYVAAMRVSSSAHRIEHEINNVSVAMLSAAFATVPPAQHALLLSTIAGAIIGQHVIDPGMIEQTCHNIRDAALGVYLFHHPEVAVTLGNGLKTLLFATGKEVATLATVTSAPAATTTAAATTTTAASAGAASSTLTSTGAAHASTSLFPHSITAIIGKVGVTASTTIAAHPIVAATLLVGGACAAAYQYLSASSTSSHSDQPATASLT